MNPYEAPKARVADVCPEEILLERPPQVVLAIRLAVAGLIVGLVAMGLSWEYYSSMGGTVSLVVGQTVGLLISVWIYYKIYSGRNWARVLYLVFVLLGLLIFASSTVRAQIFAAPLIARASTVVNNGIALAVLWLLFTRPGSTWFKKSRHAPAA